MLFWHRDRGRSSRRMILCGDKKFNNGYRKGAGVSFSPSQTSGGGRKWRSRNKEHSYVTISDRD